MPCLIVLPLLMIFLVRKGMFQISSLFLPSFRGSELIRDLAGETHINLSLHIGPLFCPAERPDEFLERPGIFRCIFESGEEVEGFAQVIAMIQAACNPCDVFQANGNVVRALFKDRPPFILGQFPPGS